MAEDPGIAIHQLPVQRTARVATLGDPPAEETWLALHGYGQLAPRFLKSFVPAARDGRAILAPEGLSRFYTSRDPTRVGATWMTREARENEISDYLAYLDQVMGRFAPADGRLQVHGFSQGTATALRWVAHTDRPVSAVVLWGGGIPPELDLDALRGRQSGMAWQVCVGRDDELITEEAIEAETGRLAAAGIPFSLHRFDGGHQVHADTLLALGGAA